MFGKTISAYSEGSDAFDRGIPRRSNPYDNEHPFHGDWNRGWDDAHNTYKMKKEASGNKTKNLIKG